MSLPQTELPRRVLGGTDGFRGTATTEPGAGLINPETVAGLTYALVVHQQEQGLTGPVVVARDPRRSGEALLGATIAGALAAGVEVVDLGVMPTPGAQRVAQGLGALATVVITASHNRAKDNGWKGMIGKRKPSSTEVRAISNRYWQQVDSGLAIPVDSAATPRSETHLAFREQYIRDIVADITREYGEAPLAGKLFVADGANGAAMNITPQVFTRLGARVEKFCCDGSRPINEGCGAADLSGLRAFLASRPDITSDPDFVGAVANDGDADRSMGVGMVDGVLVDITGNHIMEALANRPLQPGIIGTIYTNSGTKERLLAAGVDFAYCGNGDVYVTNALLAKQAEGKNWTRGGEFTGHLIDTAWLPSGDGVRAAAWFAAWVVARGASFGDIHRNMPMWPERMIKLAIEVPSGVVVDEKPLVRRAVEREMTQMGGRFVVRASGTEPVVRVWGEGPNAAQINVAVGRIAAAVMSSP